MLLSEWMVELVLLLNQQRVYWFNLVAIIWQVLAICVSLSYRWVIPFTLLSENARCFIYFVCLVTFRVSRNVTKWHTILFNFLILKVLAYNYGFKARLRFFDLLRRGTTIKINSNVQLISIQNVFLTRLLLIFYE